MKKNLLIPYLISLFVFVVLLVSLSTVFAPATPRLPSENYVTLEEEYIDAIEHFNHTGDVFVPSGARFSYDNEKITITDINSGAYVSCTFVLNGTVPVYSYTYNKSIILAILPTVISLIAMFACYDGITSYLNKRKYKVLDKIKKNATYGDDRQNSSNCSRCYKKENCKCIQCPYATDCGRCPSSDCEDVIEDMLQEHIQSEKATSEEDDILKDTAETSPCECQHESCIQEFESEHVQEKKDSVIHTLDGSKGEFECTPDCSNFAKCECMQDCPYVQECHSCPYPGCTHDIQKELLGMNNSKDTSDN